MINATAPQKLAMFAAVALAFVLAGAARPSAADVPPFKTSMASMRFLLGTWTCSVKAIDGSTPQVTTVTTMSSDGATLLTKTIAGGEGTSSISLDPNKLQWVQTSQSSKGSSTQTSSGIAGNTITWLGTLTASGMPAMGYRTTLVKVSDAKTQQTDELGAPGTSTWLTADTATCVKR